MNVLRFQNFGILGGFTLLALLVFVSGVSAQDKMAGNTVLTTVPDAEYIVPETGGGIGPSPVYEMPCEECCCECQEQRSHGLRANLSATACFNCRTNGSYKFPVPRQYTYFWPGIYSQKTMTEYVAPHNGLKLRSPAEVFDSDLDEEK